VIFLKKDTVLFQSQFPEFLVLTGTGAQDNAV